MVQKPTLSILIPTVVGREVEYKKLFDNIFHQCPALQNYDESKSYAWGLVDDEPDKVISVCLGGIISIITEKDDKRQTIGEKRELLYKKSNGIYSWQIDDDDSIAPNAIELILKAIEENHDVDCITFEEHIDIDGKIQRSNHSLKYGDWADNSDGFDYVRTPFMKSVIKTEIARSVPIPHIRFGEDHQWAQALKPYLKTEIHIGEQIYKYIHRSSDFNERYGIRTENSEPTNY